MSKIQSTFEKSLENYTGNKAKLLSVSDFTLKLKSELPTYFCDWMNPELTGEPALGPIAEVKIEIDQLAYAYTGLFNKQGLCMVSEGSSPDLYDWGLSELYEEDPKLVTQFLALCFEKVLPEACKLSEFLKLPRAEKVVFSLGEHSGWEYDEVYVYNGELHELYYGNVRLKRLAKEISLHSYTELNTVEQRFINHLLNINIRKCADELIPVFKEFLHWLSHQNPEPLKNITIGWSSNFDKESAFGGINDGGVCKWSGTFDFSKWFAMDRPKDLDRDGIDKVRYCVSLKIAEIACLASETLVDLEVFKKLPKKDNFFMQVMNRTAGFPPRFYPFNK